LRFAETEFLSLENKNFKKNALEEWLSLTRSLLHGGLMIRGYSVNRKDIMNSAIGPYKEDWFHPSVNLSILKFGFRQAFKIA
jgi:hypothetical protein